MTDSFVHPEVLVTTDWVKENLNNPKVKIVEIDVDTKAYEAGHVPGAHAFNWQTQLQDTVRRDIIDQQSFEFLLRSKGVRNDDTVVLYGDNNNWFAAYGFWLFKLYGHADVRLMDGGRVKWLAEDDKPLTTDPPGASPSTYAAKAPDRSLRALLPEVIEGSRAGVQLIDVRSVDEYTGKIIAPPGMTETAQRAGHIPGAKNVPWVTAVAPDGTFKPASELRKIYMGVQGAEPKKPTITYCRIGERSSHTWFALRYLLGFNDVKNYDGSWTEYGNVIGLPISNPSSK
jgi:thiosulfate/3-mercaptopyruvate sulfurtransferase